ncbi:PLP-dependent aminotransferase family protein [Fredinandcohnia quinoae]|uniref:PLP-dependent aminotransferase family protein n=1 Tax=Fredinandcohnia quinoae TaxID=2918902 RepID=A0AAW5E2M4_9BACI|nr:PLP-dependent aminotransferase family protein [Fredinandcohnia sp. SECRCQ15]MCH1625024.1 PLP-dependent aminotransferase family protein [Fredinandcohnia sp. SECRCQ15]
MLWFHVERKDTKSLTQQVYEQIRMYILDGDLKVNEKLPSTRELATSVGVSRNIVLEVYDQLVAEGYLVVRPKSGTYVAPGSSFKVKSQQDTASYQQDQPGMIEQNMIDFRAAHPAMDHFPRKVWGRLAKEICYDAPDSIFGYHVAGGHPELKRVLAAYLLRTRGVKCDPNQIVITSGATQALSIITELLVDAANPYVAVEDPVTYEMRNIFSYAGASIRPIPVDHEGIQPEFLSNDEPPSFIFVIPSHQFPLGGTLTIQRRIKLIEYARQMNCYIVEDDYDSEFTYEGSPVPSLQGLDPGKVLYVGTFSKILSPALRIGYVVLPTNLIEPFQTLKWYTDRHNSSLEQLILARFIEEGNLDKHIRKMRKVYQQRRKALVDGLLATFPECTILGQAAGMHLVVELKNIIFDSHCLQRIEDQGVRVYPVEDFSLVKGKHMHQIVIGYGSLTVDEIKDGISRLKKALYV